MKRLHEGWCLFVLCANHHSDPRFKMAPQKTKNWPLGANWLRSHLSPYVGPVKTTVVIRLVGMLEKRAETAALPHSVKFLSVNGTGSNRTRPIISVASR